MVLKLFIIFLISSFSYLNGQTISYYFEKDYVVEPDSTFTASIQVDSFIDVGGLGMSIWWNPGILEYQEFQYQGVEPSDIGGINEQNVSDGRIGVIWLSPSAAEGLTLPDSTVLFSIVFKAIGLPGDTTSLSFYDAPVPSESYNNVPAVIPSEFLKGFVQLSGNTSAEYNSAPERIKLDPPTPNPFSENTLIQFELQQATEADIRIVDQLGRLVYNNRQFLPAGKQSLPVARDMLPQAGTYYFLMQAKNFRVTQKLVLVDR